MNQQIRPTMDKPAFRRWLVEREGRFELENGRVIDVTAGSKNHNRLISNFLFELRSRLDADTWTVLASDMAVEIGDSVRFPDLVVERLDAPGGPLAADEPRLLVEVLSPSSVGRDMRTKAAEYTQLTTVSVYVVASQDEPRLWVWQRDAATGVFPAEPVEIAGLEENVTVAFSGLSMALPLAALYRGISG